jgi:hypothetical protein
MRFPSADNTKWMNGIAELTQPDEYEWFVSAIRIADEQIGLTTRRHCVVTK